MSELRNCVGIRFLTLAFAVSLCLLVVGCSDKKFKTHKVNGKVTFENGDPVKYGRVEFYQPGQDVTARGTLREDGTFTLGTETVDDGAVAGEHQVVVIQVIMPGELGMTPHDHGAHVDDRFSSFRLSELVFTVAENDENFAEFVVKQAK